MGQMKPRPKMTFVTNKRWAFTFIELLIVIIIIATLTAISIPNFRKTFDNLELENFVKDIYYLARYLQASSAAENRIYYLEINRENAEFQAKYLEGNELKAIAGRFGKIYKAPKEVVLTIEPADLTGVYFYPDASSDKISITLKNKHNKQISLIAKGITSEIQIK